VTQNVERLLDLFERHDVSATFFVLGWVAEHCPEIVETIDAHGHEIASHGYNHRLLYEQSRDEVRTDIERSLDSLQPLTQQTITGYRAPSFSITDWAIEILQDMGFEYDSSYLRATGHDRYGSLEVNGTAPITSVKDGFREVQLPVISTPVGEFPCAGGAYFRVIPYPIYRRLITRVQNPFVFYLHPWEIDPEQPRLRDAPLSNRLRHYTNLDKTEARLKRLLREFDWSAIESTLD
jgi:polysaccharide deacetylase family protein (PEP-CTERM system associated)